MALCNALTELFFTLNGNRKATAANLTACPYQAKSQDYLPANPPFDFPIFPLGLLQMDLLLCLECGKAHATLMQNACQHYGAHGHMKMLWSAKDLIFKKVDWSGSTKIIFALNIPFYYGFDVSRHCTDRLYFYPILLQYTIATNADMMMHCLVLCLLSTCSVATWFFASTHNEMSRFRSFF